MLMVFGDKAVGHANVNQIAQSTISLYANIMFYLANDENICKAANDHVGSFNEGM